MADGATAELRGRRRPLPEASEPGRTRGPLKLMGGPALTPLGLGIGPLLWEFFRSDVRITHWKHLCFSTILASCCKLPFRTARCSREADPKLSWCSQGSRGGLADRNHPEYRAAWQRWAGCCGTPRVTVQKPGGCPDAHRVFGPP